MARYMVNVNGIEFDIEVKYQSEKYMTMTNGVEQKVEFHKVGENRAVLLVNGKSLDVDINSNGYDSNQTVFLLGQEIPIEIENYNLAQLRKTAGMSSGPKIEKIIKAPMPGLVLEVKVKSGDTVKKNDPLLIIEAMKMENVLKATADGIIKEVYTETGNSVEKNDKLLELE